MGLLGSLIGAGSSLLGGLFGGNSAAKQAKKVGTHSIQWRVEDANKAGVNPIYALGSPVMAPMADVGNPIATGISNMGQDLGRAADSMTTSSRRSADLANAVGALGLERAKLENDILRQQLLSSKMAVQRQAGGLPPAQPVRASKELPGQGNNPLVDPQKQEVTAVDPARPSQEPGRIPDLGFANVGGGGFSPVMSRDQADRQQDSFAQEMVWMLRNQLAPSLGFSFNPPAAPTPGMRWGYDFAKQAYVQVPEGLSVYEYNRDFPTVTIPSRKGGKWW